MKKHILKLDYDEEIHLYGIVSPDKDYRICAFINQLMGYRFSIYHQSSKIDSSSIDEDFDPNPIRFPFYHYPYKEDTTDLYFINNHLENETLIPELKKFDYFLLIRGIYPEEETKELLSALRSIETIGSAIAIPLKPKIQKFFNSIL